MEIQIKVKKIINTYRYKWELKLLKPVTKILHKYTWTSVCGRDWQATLVNGCAQIMRVDDHLFILFLKI